ncbi:hypothetical protein L1987_18096 [Smallanthus sonchifolius]|uniref:Uncharacterized protein n=2 Tax=Smallanthus sonchifolius TaxID=185202 RepID=A0ACB9J0A3_9ASTR|nr:hypothetical protein L1987_18095 [Smallanthus sonchifolius]KAI3813374.1 hypothetical protein L1987_18096 [Smallanthus sonchifolius]
MRITYELWQARHGKTYNALGEKESRFQIFSDNLRFIDEHNFSGNRTYTVGLNQFADLTNEEYRSMYLGTKADPYHRIAKMQRGEISRRIDMAYAFIYCLMASESDSSSQPQTEGGDVKASASTVADQNNSLAVDSSPVESMPIVSSSDEVPNFPQPTMPEQNNLQAGSTGKWAIARLASGFGLHLAQKTSGANANAGGVTSSSPSAVLQSVGKGLVDTSLGAVKAVQVRARHMVSQNKRRYQEGGFDLDLTYITDNIIAMGFPAGDLSSGLFGYFEDKYKVYNLCSERLYDASLFAGKVACFPFNDHNCPPINLIPSFCQSAYSWLKDDILNVVVVHCKAGKARTGLMICSLLLFLKIFPTAHECIDYYNQRRCVDGKGLILPSQIVSYLLQNNSYLA